MSDATSRYSSASCRRALARVTVHGCGAAGLQSRRRCQCPAPYVAATSCEAGSGEAAHGPARASWHAATAQGAKQRVAPPSRPCGVQPSAPIELQLGVAPAVSSGSQQRQSAAAAASVAHCAWLVAHPPRKLHTATHGGWPRARGLTAALQRDSFTSEPALLAGGCTATAAQAADCSPAQHACQSTLRLNDPLLGTTALWAAVGAAAARAAGAANAKAVASNGIPSVRQPTKPKAARSQLSTACSACVQPRYGRAAERASYRPGGGRAVPAQTQRRALGRAV